MSMRPFSAAVLVQGGKNPGRLFPVPRGAKIGLFPQGVAEHQMYVRYEFGFFRELGPEAFLSS